MIIQIYEIQTPREAEKCIESGVNQIGSVLLSQETWRLPSLKKVMGLSQEAGVKNSIIPLFRDINTLYMALDYYNPDYVHLCDSLTEQDGREMDMERHIRFQIKLKEKFPEIGIIRSIPIPLEKASPHFPALKIASVLEPFTDIFLTDTWLGKEPVHGYIGITGKKADWELSGKLVDQSKIPVILAGGLSPENVFSALKNVLPAGADSCTQTNSVDKKGRPIRFMKDFNRVGKFVNEVVRFEQEAHSKKKV